MLTTKIITDVAARFCAIPVTSNSKESAPTPWRKWSSTRAQTRGEVPRDRCKLVASFLLQMVGKSTTIKRRFGNQSNEVMKPTEKNIDGIQTEKGNQHRARKAPKVRSQQYHQRIAEAAELNRQHKKYKQQRNQ